MESLSLQLIVALMLVAFLAGMVDSIGGGGGLLTMPVLLWAGLPPVAALATNKLQSSWGTFAATLNYWRAGQLQPGHVKWIVVLTFAGSAAGTLAVQVLNPDFLMHVIPFLLLAVAVYFLLQPQVGNADRQQRMTVGSFAYTAGFSIGFYDGFFGPGTGSFFAIACVLLLGFNLLRATAHTKLFNLSSNLAALLFFMPGGHVIWQIGLPMAVAQLAGGYFGSRLTLSKGARIIRPVLIMVSLALTIRLFFFG